MSDFKDKIVTSAAIEKISRSDKGVAITFAEDGHLSLASRKASLETHQSTGKLVQHFDQVVFATHSDEALALLEDASLAEKSVLGAIPYCDNSVVLHYDESFLPKRKRAWSSWNYRIDKGDDALPIVTYNMNILQGFNDPKTFCVTLNAENEIDPSKIIEKFSYAHPQFSIEATHAQDRWSEINGVNNTWYCGAYWANGFHEDGVTSALRVAEQFGEFL